LKELTCFKAYDIRGQLGTELDEDIAYWIGRGYAQRIKPQSAVLGGDARETSEAIKQAVARGLMDSGVDVIDIGQVGTEEVYFAVQHLGVDGGIEITASHNPIDYNGMKPVGKGSRPISGETGLLDIKKIAEQAIANKLPQALVASKAGSYRKESILGAYVEHLLTYINPDNLKPMKVVVNSGNGVAGHVIDEMERIFIERAIPIEFVKVHHEPDASFPNGIPNPILVENRQQTTDAVIQSGADFGIAWDGDFDRCFLFDQRGQFIEGYYIVGLLAEAYLLKNPGAKIIHDPRLTWNTQEICQSTGGKAVQSKTGHAFIKEIMREQDAVYGGEMSAHHYFKDFGYCDSGMIPWLLVAELICVKSVNLSTLVKERISKFPSPGEINRKVKNVQDTLDTVEQLFSKQAISVDKTDGISLEFKDWRFNLRGSNTEPVIRLNLETRGDLKLMQEMTDKILAIIES
jgi:phosphomannomutase